MENSAAEAMTDESVEDSRSIDLSSLSDVPVMIYNANPFVEDSVQRQLIALNGPSSEVHCVMPSSCKRRSVVQVDPLVPTGTPRKLKNGCVEYIDSETGQRTRVAGDRCVALWSSLDALIDPEPIRTDDEAVDNEEPLLALFDAVDSKKESRTVPEDGALRTSTVLNRTSFARPPVQGAEENTKMEQLREPQTPHKRTRMGENVRPRAAAAKTQSEELFMRHYQNFCVLDDVLHRTSGQRGFPGHGEKVRVEMKSLEDGYKWRKYGRKEVKGNTYPRNYFKCTFPNCMCRKRVEQNPENPRMLIATYEGRHIHPPPFLSQTATSLTRDR